MEQMDYFPYMKLPSLVQEMIADEVIQNLGFIDREHFCLTSAYCNSLIQQSKMKKRIKVDRLRFEKGKMTCKIVDSESLTFKTADDVSKFLKMVEFTRMDLGSESFFALFSDLKSGFNSPLKNLWFNAMESLKVVNIFLFNDSCDSMMEILPKLINLKKVAIFYISTPATLLKIIDVLPKLPKLTFYGEIDDGLLNSLASKSSKSNPFKKLTFAFSNDFSVNAVEQFFNLATFADLSCISLDIKAKSSEIKEMFKRIDKYKYFSSIQQNGAVVTLLKNVHEESFIIVTIKCIE